MRTEFTDKTKAAAFLRANGKCEGRGCDTKLTRGKFHYDHDIACDLGGDNSLENCVVLCVPCHREKTNNLDLPAITKGRRIRRREMGIRKRSKFAGSRDSRLKKKIDGSVVLR